MEVREEGEGVVIVDSHGEGVVPVASFNGGLASLVAAK